MKFWNRSHNKQLGKNIAIHASAGWLSLVISSAALATDVTLIQVSDLHGNLVPHAAEIQEYDPVTGGIAERIGTQSGGIAKVATLVKEIRASSTASLTLGVGDSTHGSAETLFTMGDAIIPAMNALNIDAFTAGNWDYAYGPAVFRHRYVEYCKQHPEYQYPNNIADPLKVLCPVIPPNARIMVDSDGQQGVQHTNFVSLANNLYNGGPIPVGNPQFGKRTLDAYKIFTVNGVKIGVIGISSSIVTQQPPVFGRTFSFSQGVKELPGDITAAKADGAEIIVVISELGLSQNIQIGREFPLVDVVLSAHTHELTVGAILADKDGFEMVPPNMELTGRQLARLQKGAAIVAEAGEDLYVGRLDLTIADSKVQNFVWEAIAADDAVPEDAEVAALVAGQEKYFVAGPDFKTHTYLPYVFCSNFAPGLGNPVERCGGDVSTGVVKRGVRLVEPLDIKVGETEVLLHRHDSLEGAMNNFIADAFLDTLGSIARSRADVDWSNLDVVSMTNGFRFDTVVLPATMVPAGSDFIDGRKPGDITLRDIWGYFPTAAAMVAAEFSGVTIEDNLNNVLANVFSPNPYNQRGGWYLGLSENMSQKVDVVNLPLSTSGSRLVETRINGKLVDPSKRYIIASCYGHTFPLGRACRADGGSNMMFYTLADTDDYTSAMGYVPPLASEGLIDNRPGQAAVGAHAAPDNYVHPIHALRLFLDKIGVISDAKYGSSVAHRVTNVDTTHVVAGQFVAAELPTSRLMGVVQPPEGIGPGFLDRGVIINNE